MTTHVQPKWEDRHTKIIEQYEKMKREGNIKEMIIITKDN